VKRGNGLAEGSLGSYSRWDTRHGDQSQDDRSKLNAETSDGCVVQENSPYSDLSHAPVEGNRKEVPVSTTTTVVLAGSSSFGTPRRVELRSDA